MDKEHIRNVITRSSFFNQIEDHLKSLGMDLNNKTTQHIFDLDILIDDLEKHLNNEIDRIEGFITDMAYKEGKKDAEEESYQNGYNDGFNNGIERGQKITMERV